MPSVCRESLVAAVRGDIGSRQVVAAAFTSRETSFYWMWWCMPVIPATQEAEVGGSRFKADPGKNARLYLKSN
jgi:hypothetical protein